MVNINKETITIILIILKLFYCIINIVKKGKAFKLFQMILIILNIVKKLNKKSTYLYFLTISLATYIPEADACDRECVTPEPSPIIYNPL